MVIGLAIGGYFIFQSGLLIAIILAVTTLSIYFYSTTIVNIGLGETLVAVKGTMIVIGTSLVQSGIVDLPIVYLGIIIGILSSIVLYIAAFPDFDADKEKGRKTLVILIGKNKIGTNISVTHYLNLFFNIGWNNNSIFTYIFNLNF